MTGSSKPKASEPDEATVRTPLTTETPSWPSDEEMSRRHRALLQSLQDAHPNLTLQQMNEAAGHMLV